MRARIRATAGGAQPTVGVILAGALLLMSGCQWPPAKVTILLPALPRAWSGLEAEFELEYYDMRGRWRTTSQLQPGSAVAVPLNRHQHTPVLATPHVLAAGVRLALRPAGGIYPRHLDPAGRLRLDWTGGVTASVAAALWRSGADASRIDLSRLHRALRQRVEGSPWDVDRATLVEELLGGSFRVTDVRAAPRNDVTLALGEGLWARDDPFAEPLSVPATEPAQIAAWLVDGSHLLVRIPQRGDGGAAPAAIAVQVSGDTLPLLLELAGDRLIGHAGAISPAPLR